MPSQTHGHVTAPGAQGPDLAIEVERDLLSGLMAYPDRLACVREHVDVDDFAHGVHRSVFAAMLEAHEPGNLIEIAERLDGRTSLSELVAISDFEGTRGAFIDSHAARIRRNALRRRADLVAARLGSDPFDAKIRAELDELASAHAQANGQSVDLAGLAIAGNAARQVLDRAPASPGPLPNILDPEPHLHQLLGKPKVGKTTLALYAAMCWALGIAPWEGVEPLPPKRCLVLSAEQPALRILRVLERLAGKQRDPRAWIERISVVARDAELPRELRSMLTLDATGLATLRAMLDGARRAGDPFELLVLDSSSRLRPRTHPSGERFSENDSAAMTEWLDSLEQIAVDLDVWVLLIAHQGHEARSDPASAARGASSQGAVAQANMLLQRGKEPRQRILKVDGNVLLSRSFQFEVADEDEPPDAITKYRLVEPDRFEAERFLEHIEPGHLVGTSEFARRAFGGDSGRARAQAAEARDQLVTLGLVRLVDGTRGQKLMERAESSGGFPGESPVPPADLPDLPDLP